MINFKYVVESEPSFAGRNEFGIPLRGFLHFIVAVSPEGARFAHFHAELSESPVMPPTTARLLQRVTAKRPDPRFSDFWTQTDPVAGSPADLADREVAERFAAMEDEMFGRLDAPDGNVRWD